MIRKIRTRIYKIRKLFRDEHLLRRDGKLFIFLICFVISSFFWTLNNLSKNYTARISFPVKYIDLPTDKKLSQPLPQKLECTVNAYGFTLLRHKLRLSFSPILINVGELRIRRKTTGNNHSSFSASTEANRSMIINQISNEIQVLNIYPDSLFFNFEPIIERKFPVKPEATISLLSQYILKQQPFTDPDSVMVKGPQDVLDTLKFVYTRNQSYKDLSHSVQRNVSLAGDNDLQFSPRRVVLNIPVEQITEGTREIPLVIKHVPDSIQLKSFPATIKVSYKVGLSQYDQITGDSFLPVIDYDSISSSREKLPVTMEKSPQNIISYDYYPKDVEFILEKKNSSK